MSDWTPRLPDTLPATLHGSAISAHGRALVFCGPSGSGKTSLALQMLALGAGLISDDLVCLEARDTEIMVQHPKPTQPLQALEARGFAILRTDLAPAAPLSAFVDMSKTSVHRVPTLQTQRFGTCEVPIFHKVDSAAFPAILMHYLRHGLYDDRNR